MGGLFSIDRSRFCLCTAPDFCRPARLYSRCDIIGVGPALDSPLPQDARVWVILTFVGLGATSLAMGAMFFGETSG